jgi:hypothetical protein
VSAQKRSRVCPKALTLNELRKLRRGERVAVFYDSKLGPRYALYTYNGLKTEGKKTKIVLDDDGVISETSPEGFGLVPFSKEADRGALGWDDAVNSHGWSTITCVVREEDIPSLPIGRKGRKSRRR